MTKSYVYLPILLAGLLAAAGVRAQGAPAAGSSDARNDAPMGAGAAATSNIAPKSGEASTYVQGRPNVDPNMPAANKDSKKQALSIMGAAPATASEAPKTRAEVVAELMGRRAAFEAERKAMRDSKHVAPRS